MTKNQFRQKHPFCSGLLAAFFVCQCWFNAFVTLASQVRSLTCSINSNVAKNLTLFEQRHNP